MNLFIIIVGGNNISNYALVKYFKEKKSFDTLALVYSTGEKGTKSKADIIKDFFKNKLNIIDINIGNKAGCLDCVCESVYNALLKKNIKYLHLDFTGGTKAMSLGTYLAVTKLVNEKKLKNSVNYTYIESYKVVFKDGSIFPDGEKNLKYMVSVSIDEIIRLHEHNIISKHEKESDFYNEEFVLFLIDKAKNSEKEFYEDMWDKKEIKKLKWKNSLETAPINFEIDNISNRNLKKLQKFITGGFLEEYIFKVLLESKDELSITDILYSVDIKNKDGQNFELDIIISKGYELYVISCTTEHKGKGLNKSKLFEVAKRAKEIGGREAKFVLATLMSEEEKNFNDLKKELTNESKDYDLIGLETIKDKNRLKQKLKEIFNER